MNISVHYQSINEQFQAATPEDALKKFKAEASKRAPFLLRAAIGAMSDLRFAQEVVNRANTAQKRQDPAPKTAQEFLDWAQTRGFITVTP